MEIQNQACTSEDKRILWYLHQHVGHNFSNKSEFTDSYFQQQINLKYFTGAGLGCGGRGGGPNSGQFALSPAQELKAEKTQKVQEYRKNGS
jgi:hypothetical protein